MGKVRDLKRKQQRLRLLEKRLAKQGRPQAVVADETRMDEIKAKYHKSGYDAGKLDAYEDSLTIAKETKTVTTIRRKLGDRVRRARAKSGALTNMDLSA